MVRKISCKNCGKVLLEADIRIGIIIKDCPKCGKKNVYEFSAKPRWDQADRFAAPFQTQPEPSSCPEQ